MWQFWLIAAGVFLIGEIFTVGFLIFWLGIAALLSMLVSFFTDNLIIQGAVFVIASGILIFFTKPFVDKYVTRNQKSVKTNAFSVKTVMILVIVIPMLLIIFCSIIVYMQRYRFNKENLI